PAAVDVVSRPTAPAVPNTTAGPGRRASRVALVTGGSGTLGAAIARQLAGDGRTVVVAHRSGAERAEAVATEIRDGGGRAAAVPLDVTDPASVDAAFERIEHELGPVEILVNNAGTTADGLFLRMALDTWQRPFETSVDGTFRVTRRVV